MISLLENSTDGLPERMLVGLVGLAGSGKDSCASMLQPLGFVQVAFADKLREEVAVAFGIDIRALTDPVLKHRPLAALAVVNSADSAFVVRMEALGHDPQAPRSARWLMQHWGTEYRRAQHQAYWVDKVVQRVAGLRDAGYQRFCISDVRMPDEAACVIVLGGHLVRVQRADAQSHMDAEARRHSSEQYAATAPVQATIVNDGTLDDLSRELVVTLTGLGEPPIAQPDFMRSPGAAC